MEEIVPEKLPDHWLWGEGALPNFVTYLWYRKNHDATIGPDLLTAAVLRNLMANKLGEEPHLASPYYGIEDVVRHDYSQALGCDDPFEGDSFEGTCYLAESLMVFLVRSNLKQTCKRLWPDFTKLSHERLIPDQPWQFCLYRTGEAATNETKIYPRTFEWTDLQEVARQYEASDVPHALKADPVLLLLFINIFPFRASFSVMRFLHKEFDGMWLL